MCLCLVAPDVAPNMLVSHRSCCQLAACNYISHGTDNGHMGHCENSEGCC